MLECVDIITVDGVGISVWAKEIPEDETKDGPLGDDWIDLIYPSNYIPGVEIAIDFAKQKLGHFVVKSAG